MIEENKKLHEKIEELSSSLKNIKQKQDLSSK